MQNCPPLSSFHLLKACKASKWLQGLCSWCTHHRSHFTFGWPVMPGELPAYHCCFGLTGIKGYLLLSRALQDPVRNSVCLPKLICKSKQHESATGHCSTPVSLLLLPAAWILCFEHRSFPVPRPNWSSLIQFPFLFFLWVILVLCSVFNKCLKWMKELINYLGLYKGI